MNVAALQAEAGAKLTEARTPEEVEAVKVAYLGRKGVITEILKGLSSLPIEERKAAGQAANVARAALEAAVEARLQDIKKTLLAAKLSSEKIDISPELAFPFPSGSRHPQTMDEMLSIFRSLGFAVGDGPEIETDWYNFQALNIPADHPARDTQDTFYLEGYKQLLRTHTSPGQVHAMESCQPPLKIVIPGRVYRNEATDATHSAIFHQIEGLAVDKNVTFADLKGTLALFIHRLFGSSINLRFRPSHFQFTEPSAEVDIQCTICGGKGCRVCKNTGWLEVLGSGMVHPNVFKAVKYDPEKYTGFAFGMGVERFVMFMYGIDDMRLLYENNLQFLKQF
jgi:phenylalanyl-tRNA synthetase alpha chain